ncbi:DUF1178 family protein [Azospirillum sp. YIM DDC1]|uniref:DUF1178 family protein n=1 Tax=Azospirillum aestuarii TaxID=2802052 RepID=A0ABS1HX21_9PROT|nr:DUF1178 family protein [Azospirillum aestuarii]MBK4719377.1 DUF1178 family protein [Azospirillum aestuarii]
MILFVLKCTADHRFEAWFRNGDAYETQAAARAIACPVCGDTHIAKAPMAPRIAKGGRPKDDAPRESGAPEAVPAADGGATAPAAPPASATSPVPEEMRERLAAEVMRQLADIRRTVEGNCDYVGDRFAEEARRIHYGETDPRGIYGEATDKEAEELKEEGVTFGRIPWLPRTNS